MEILSFLEPHVRERASSLLCPYHSQATSVPLSTSPGTHLDAEAVTLYLTEVLPSTQTCSPLAESAPDSLFLAPAVFQEPSPPTSMASPAPPFTSIPGSRQPKKRQRDEFDNKILQVLEQPTDKRELLLLGLAPRIRNLPPEKIRVFTESFCLVCTVMIVYSCSLSLFLQFLIVISLLKDLSIFLIYEVDYNR